MQRIETEEQLELTLSSPSERDVETLRRLAGDLIILGAAGKMGPSLARRIARASRASGISRRILAVSRFSSSSVRNGLEDSGIETESCDLLDRDEVARLPICQNVLFLAGRKFGSAGRPDLTWAMNTITPAHISRHFRTSRIVAFSTGNVYPFVDVPSGGSREADPPDPRGEYAQSCLGRERVFEFFSIQNKTPCLIFRLNYAVDLRYGVLVDVARKVRRQEPIDLTVGYFNSIWQGDANSYALRALEYCESPPRYLNVTGPEIISVREAAMYFGSRFGCDPIFQGTESATALLSNASECFSLLGKPEVSLEQLMGWVARWIEHGGKMLDKPTKYEVTDGRY